MGAGPSAFGTAIMGTLRAILESPLRCGWLHGPQQLQFQAAELALVIQQEGAAKRKSAEAELGRIEGELKAKLLELRG